MKRLEKDYLKATRLHLMDKQIASKQSPRHPHERWQPPIPAVLDMDGRCRVCVIIVERDEAQKNYERAVRNHEREVHDLGEQLTTIQQALTSANLRTAGLVKRAVSLVMEATKGSGAELATRLRNELLKD